MATDNLDPTSAIPLIDPLLKLVGRAIKAATGKAMDRKAKAALAEAMMELLQERPDMARVDALMYGVEQSGHKSFELLKARERYALVRQSQASRILAAAKRTPASKVRAKKSASATATAKKVGAPRPAKKVLKRG